MSRCPHCSFDPTGLNDFCVEHRPKRETMTNTPERSQVIAEMEQLLAGITPGEWTWDTLAEEVQVEADNRIRVICELGRWDQNDRDGHFIAAAPRLLRAALALLRKDEEEVTEAREAFKEMHEAACVESGKAEAAEAKLTEAQGEIASLAGMFVSEQRENRALREALDDVLYAAWQLDNKPHQLFSALRRAADKFVAGDVKAETLRLLDEAYAGNILHGWRERKALSTPEAR